MMANMQFTILCLMENKSQRTADLLIKEMIALHTASESLRF